MSTSSHCTTRLWVTWAVNPHHEVGVLQARVHGAKTRYILLVLGHDYVVTILPSGTALYDYQAGIVARNESTTQKK
jgi:hypothetical protein